MAEVLSIQDETHFDGIIKEGGSHVYVVHFSANWAPQCQQMNDVLKELAKDTQFIHCKFLTLEAEDVPVISERYNISAVPTFIFIKNQKEVDRLDGANAGELTKKLKVLALASSVTTSEPAPQPKEDLNTRLKKLIEAAPVMVFMKGTPAEPRCGFSRQMVQLLNERNVKFSSFDILQDEEVRQGLKTYSNWPTFPQLYVNGELLGGADIVKEMAESGELDSNLPQQATLEDRLRVLINKAPVMLFMKGSSEQPKCGFSKQMVQLLAETNVEYQTFDILTDEEVRQGLKTFSNWPTYPQLYVKGELIGGVDIVKELKESGELEKVLKEGQS